VKLATRDELLQAAADAAHAPPAGA